MKKRIQLTTFFILLMAFTPIKAQQDPQYTQYRYNLSVVNPAYAGTKGALSIAALYRKQWSKFDGAPETITFSGHSPIGEKSGIGLSVISDRLGPVNETNIYADYSYTLNFDDYYFLSLGLKGGLTFHEVGLTDLETTDPNDPLFSENINNNYPNVGAGAYLYTEDFFVGFSIPNFLNSVHLDESGIQYGSERNHFFFTAGLLKQVDENVWLKPSFLVKSAINAPLSLDINLTSLIYDRFEIGASYRLDDSFSGLIGFYVTESLRLGYAYDRVISAINQVAPSSHEAIITYDLVSGGRGRSIPSRFR